MLTFVHAQVCNGLVKPTARKVNAANYNSNPIVANESHDVLLVSFVCIRRLYGASGDGLVEVG